MAQKSWRRKLQSAPTGFEQWGGYMDAKIQKLNDQFSLKAANEEEVTSNSANTKIFSGVSIFVNGFTVPSAEDLKNLMALHGGVYHAYYSQSKTTHIIATNLPHFKIKKLRGEKVVKPEWITESISRGKLLPCSEYQIYTSVYNTGQSKLSFNASSDVSSSSSDKEFPSQSSNTNEIFFEKESIDCTKSAADCEKSKTQSEDSNSQEIPNCEMHSAKNETQQLNPNENSVSNSDNSAGGRVVQAGQPNFLADYYSHSRLHHISTAAADFKEFVNKLHANHNGEFLGRDKFFKWKTEIPVDTVLDFTLSKNQKVIIHLDMDCFFVSVALRYHPELIGKPVAVTHAKGNNVPARPGSNAQFEHNFYKSKYQKHNSNEDGEESKMKFNVQENIGSTSEVASCSYEARQCGVKNGMFLGEAFRRCPNLQLVPYDFEGYTEVSQALYNLVSSLTLDIEAISCDEMFIDCADLLRAINCSPSEVALFLREQISLETRCTASAGIGSSILVARLATRYGKPNGQYYVKPEDESAFMKKQLVKDLPGVGYSTQSRLQAMNVSNCEDLQNVPLSSLQKEFGPKTGKTLFDHCRGKDERVVKTEKERKSVSAEINYGMRFQKAEEPVTFLKELAEEVEKRLKKINKKGKLITLKIKIRSKDAPVETVKFMGHGVCDNVAKSMTFHLPTDSAEFIGREAVNCLKQLNVPHQDIRGMGIQVSRLVTLSGTEKEQTKTLFHFLKNVPSTSNANHPMESYDPKPGPTKIDLPVAETPKIDEPEPHNTNISAPEIQITNDVDFEEIDQSFLDALPDDIRQEVLQEYKSKKMRSAATLPSTSVKPSSSKSHTSKKTIKIKMSPRKKRSPKKLSPIKQNSIKDVFSATNKKANSTKPEEISKSVDGFSKSQQLQSRNTKPSLCGAVDLDSQRKLIAEWIKSSEPIDEDTNTFLCFMLTLIDNKDLERLDLIIKCFYRNVNNENKKEWETAYNNLINEVQREMKLNYGSVLKLNIF